MMSILSAWSAAIELPQLTSTVSILAPSVAAIALPIEMPRPDDHSPVFGSLENQGGAWVTPTRKVPRFLTSSSVPSARAANGIASRPPPAASTVMSERRLMVMSHPFVFPDAGILRFAPHSNGKKGLIRLVAQELAGHGDLHAVALLVGLALHGHVEVDGAHDAVAELLLDQLLPGGAIDLHQLVEAIDQRIGRRHLRQRAAIGHLLQEQRFFLAETEQLGGLGRLLLGHLHLAHAGGGDEDRKSVV